MHQPGDIVSRRKGIFMHRGIVLEDGSILHNTPIRGLHESSLDAFSKGKATYPSRHSPELREVTLSRARQDDRRRYNPFTNNCEHTVTRATGSKANSPQLRGYILGGVFAVAGFALTRHPAVAVAGFALGKKLGSRRGLT